MRKVTTGYIDARQMKPLKDKLPYETKVAVLTDLKRIIADMRYFGKTDKEILEKLEDEIYGGCP